MEILQRCRVGVRCTCMESDRVHTCMGLLYYKEECTHGGESIECRVGREDPRVRRFELIGGVHIKPGFRSEKWEEWEGYISGRALLRRPRPPI